MQTKYDIIVIGGGPAGMIAAGRAGERGARVLLIEKNKSLGKKLLITGKGRCNLTNAIFDVREFTKKFGQNGKFLYSSLYQFGVQDTINFFNKNKVPTKIERGKRVFPKSDESQHILFALTTYLGKNHVEIKTETKVKTITFFKNKVEKVILENGEIFKAKKYIICTGGQSYPATGSSGDGYKWIAKSGHIIVPPQPALTPIIVKELWIKELEGLSLKNVDISIYQKNKKIDSRFGEALFTLNGLSGPIILDMSKSIAAAIKNGETELRIDFKPALNLAILDKRIQKDFAEFSKKIFKNSLEWLLPKKLIPVIVKLSEINPQKQVNSITKEERKKLLHLLKEFKLQVKKIDGFNNAIITAGGVSLKEVNSKTMQSKLIENLYFAGEILDLDGPTGGFNLQSCWTTGYAAGENCA